MFITQQNLILNANGEAMHALITRSLVAASILAAFTSSHANSCLTADEIQDAINARALRLQGDYPMTFAALKSCITKAKTNDEVGGCMVAACTTASLGAANDREGCADFTSRLMGIAERQSALAENKKSLLHCTFSVRPLF